MPPDTRSADYLQQLLRLRRIQRGVRSSQLIFAGVCICDALALLLIGLMAPHTTVALVLIAAVCICMAVTLAIFCYAVSIIGGDS